MTGLRFPLFMAHVGLYALAAWVVAHAPRILLQAAVDAWPS